MERRRREERTPSPGVMEIELRPNLGMATEISRCLLTFCGRFVRDAGVLSRLRIERGVVDLIGDDGQLTLARAFMPRSKPDKPTGNLRLDHMLGAACHHVDSRDWNEWEAKAAALETDLRQQGRVVYRRNTRRLSGEILISTASLAFGMYTLVVQGERERRIQRVLVGY